jgi:pilus assembly protein Flp/PilA
MKQLLDFLKDQTGATAVEYAIMVSLVAALVIAVVTTLGSQVSSLFQSATQGW